MAAHAALDALRPSGPSGWVVLDDDGRIAASDAVAAAVLGGSTGDRLVDRVAPPDRPALDASLAGGGPPRLVGGRHPDGTPFSAWVERLVVASAPAPMLLVRRAGGPVARGDANPRTVDAAVAPGAAEPDRGIDSVLSHDLRASLRQATGFVTVARRGLPPDAERIGDHLDIARRSLATADGIAEAVVRWLRLGDAPMIVRPVPLRDVVARAVATLAARDDAVARAVDRMGAGAFEVGGTDAAASDACPPVVVDPEVATIAVTELLANAVTFGRPGGDAGEPAIELAVDRSDDWCLLRIADHGPGIEAAFVADAFAPGRMLQPRGEHPGVGMGLAIAELVARRHGGWCAIEARDDGAPGAVAVLGLPVG